MAATCYNDLTKDITELLKRFRRAVQSDPRSLKKTGTTSPVTRKFINERIGDIFKDVEDGLKQYFRLKQEEGITTKELHNMEIMINRRLAQALDMVNALENAARWLGPILKTAKNRSEVKEALKRFALQGDRLNHVARVETFARLSYLLSKSRHKNQALNPEQIKAISELVAESMGRVNGDDILTKKMAALGETDTFTAMAKALEEGHYGKDAEMDAIAKALKALEEEMVVLGENTTQLKALKGFVLPVDPDVNKMISKGEKEWVEEMLDLIDIQKTVETKRKFDPNKPKELSPEQELKEARKILTEFYKRKTIDREHIRTMASTTRFAASRPFYFRNADAEIEFHKMYSKSQLNPVGQKLRHLIRMQQSFSVYNALGADPLHVFRLTEHMAESTGHMSKTEAAEVMSFYGDRILEPHRVADEVASVSDDAVDAISNIISSSLTGFSAVRNVMVDNSLIPAMVSANMYQEGGYLYNFAKQMAGMTKQATLSKSDKEFLNQAFAESGILLAYRNLDLMKGQHTNTNIQTEGFWGKASQVTGDLNNKINTISGADAVFNAGRRLAAVEFNRFLFKILDSLTKDGKMKPLTTGLKAVFEENGFDDAMLHTLSFAKRTQLNGKDVTITRQSILSIPDQHVKGMQLGYETPAQAKLRLANTYTDVVEEVASMSAAVPRATDNPTKVVGQVHPLMDAMSKFVFKFAHIAQSQYRGWVNSVVYATGGRSGHNILKTLADAGKRDPLLVAKTISALTVQGFATMWLYDYLSGRELTEMTPENMLKGFLTAGGAGWVGYLLNNMLYNEDVAGTPLQAFIRDIAGGIEDLAEGEFEDAAKHGTQLAQKLSGFGNVWFSRYGVKQLIDNAFD